MQTLVYRLARSRAAALCLLTAALCLAPAARAAEPEPVWSFGAGVSYSYGFAALGSSGVLGLGNVPSVYAPTPVVGLERRLSATDALLVAVSANLSTQKTTTPDTSTTSASLTSWGAGALVGVRHLLTDPAAVVAVSVFGGVTLAYAKGDLEQISTVYTGTPTTYQSTSHQFSCGLSGGLAIEKTLAERLSLRLSAHLLSAAYTKTAGQASAGAAWVDTNAFAVALSVDPSLELRLAF